MPIYEYKCRKCGNITEYLVGVGKNEIEEKVCRECGSENLYKIFSTTCVNSGDNFIGNQNGKTCCGREERCDSPPCYDSDGCER